MSKPTNPIPTRFGETEPDIREAAKKCGISIQDTIRIAVGFGLPVLVARLTKSKPKAPKRLSKTVE